MTGGCCNHPGGLLPGTRALGLGQHHHGGDWAAGPAALSSAASPGTCQAQGKGEHRHPQAWRCWGSNPCCLQILGEPMQNRKLVAEISLVNPLAAPLNNCMFVVEGAGLTNGQQTKEL